MSSPTAIVLARIVSLCILLGASMLAPAVPVVANPIAAPRPVDWTIDRLPEDYVRHGRRSDADRLVRRFAEQGLAQVDSRAIEYLDAHADRFKPLVLRAQTPPHVPDLGLQRWYRAHANEAERARMDAVLRRWLEHSPRGSQWWQGTERGHALYSRSFDTSLLAAQILGDARDGKAIPALSAWRSSLQAANRLEAARTPRLPLAEHDSHSPLVVLDQALLRIVDPGRAGFLCEGPGGQFVLHRSLDELESMELIADPSDPSPTTTRLGRERTRRMWDLLSTGLDLGPPRPDLPRPGLRLSFRDGLVARLTLAETGYFYYWENSRVSFEPVAHVHAPALYDSLRGTLTFTSPPAVGGGRRGLAPADFEVVPDSVPEAHRDPRRAEATRPAGPGSR